MLRGHTATPPGGTVCWRDGTASTASQYNTGSQLHVVYFAMHAICHASSYCSLHHLPALSSSMQINRIAQQVTNLFLADVIQRGVAERRSFVFRNLQSQEQSYYITC